MLNTRRFGGHLVIERARWLRGEEMNPTRAPIIGNHGCAGHWVCVAKGRVQFWQEVSDANDLGPDEGREDRVARALLENVPGLRTVSFRGEG